MAGGKTVDRLRTDISNAVSGSHGFARLQVETLVKVYYEAAGGEPSSPIFVDEVYDLGDMERRKKVARAVGFEYDPQTPRPFNHDELEEIASVVVDD